MAYRNYSVANGFIVDKLGNGDFVTIGAALTAATSGTTIFIRPGTYTENLTLKAGVNITAFTGDGLGKDGTSGNVIILGEATAAFAGTSNISGLCLKTNSSFFLLVNGSSATVVQLDNCTLDCNNNTGISFTSSSASSEINCYSCISNIDTTGIALYSASSTGNLRFYQCVLNNTGATVTASNNSSAGVLMTQCTMAMPLSTSSTGSLVIYNSNIDCSGINTTCITTAGTGTGNLYLSYFLSGTASTVSAGTGTTVTVSNCSVSSSNTNAITGAGTLNLGVVDFAGTSKNINTTTQTNINGGTFTPVLNFGGATTGITYSTQSAVFSRVGALIYYSINIVLTSKGSATGAATVTGLPFTSANNNQAPAASLTGSFIATGGNTQMIASVTANTTSIGLYFMTLSASTNIAPVPSTSFANNSAFGLSGFYTTS